MSVLYLIILEYSEVAFIESLTHLIVIFFIDRTFVRFSDCGFRKTINTSKNISVP